MLAMISHFDSSHRQQNTKGEVLEYIKYLKSWGSRKTKHKPRMPFPPIELSVRA